METPLSPLDFLRRARKLHGAREAVVDGDTRLTHSQFSDRCDRWSAALIALGVTPGDRVATIVPNTHQHLEQYYAVPQIGAVIVPLNYRLTSDDFVYRPAMSESDPWHVRVRERLARVCALDARALQGAHGVPVRRGASEDGHG
jgi:fatty-acyl-CoA synthase